MCTPGLLKSLRQAFVTCFQITGNRFFLIFTWFLVCFYMLKSRECMYPSLIGSKVANLSQQNVKSRKWQMFVPSSKQTNLEWREVRVYYGPGFDSQPRHNFPLCLILIASRVFGYFPSFSINPSRVISPLKQTFVHKGQPQIWSKALLQSMEKKQVVYGDGIYF